MFADIVVNFVVNESRRLSSTAVRSSGAPSAFYIDSSVLLTVMIARASMNIYFLKVTLVIRDGGHVVLELCSVTGTGTHDCDASKGYLMFRGSMPLHCNVRSLHRPDTSRCGNGHIVSRCEAYTDALKVDT